MQTRKTVEKIILPVDLHIIFCNTNSCRIYGASPPRRMDDNIKVELKEEV
jgi:hypothetical protein